MCKTYNLLFYSILREVWVLRISRTLRNPLGSPPKQHECITLHRSKNITFYEGEFYNHLIKREINNTDFFSGTLIFQE